MIQWYIILLLTLFLVSSIISTLRILTPFFIVALFAILFSHSVDQFKRYDDPFLNKITHKVSRVFPEMKNVTVSGSDGSFTINKKHIYMCLKDENGRYYQENMLVYVLLHELAHVLCDEVGHTPKFSKIFADLLERAEEAGVYNPNIPLVDNYCGY